MNDPIFAELISVLAGFVLGAFTSLAFYLFGRADGLISTWTTLMYLAIFRIKQTIPTIDRHEKGIAPGLLDTQNFLECLSETIRLAGWPEGATALTSVVSGMKNLERYQNADAAQGAKGESKKKEWQEQLHRQIEEVSRWENKLRLAVPALLRE